MKPEDQYIYANIAGLSHGHNTDHCGVSGTYSIWIQASNDTQFAKYCKKKKHSRYSFMNFLILPVEYFTDSVAKQEAYANGFVTKLKSLGIQATVGKRKT